MSAHLTKEELKKIAPDEYARQFPEEAQPIRSAPIMQKQPTAREDRRPRRAAPNPAPAIVALIFAAIQFALTWWIIFHF